MIDLSDIESFDFGVSFYDKFRCRIAECEKEHQNELKQEIKTHYQKISENIAESYKDKLYKVYAYLLNCFE